MLRVGKHKGRSFREISQCDRSYAAWVLRDKDAPRVFSKFRRYLEQMHGGVLEVGKHKGQYFDEVLRNSPDYCDWVKSLTDPGEAFARFLEYLERNFEDDEPPAKKTKTDVSNVCKICCDKEIDTVFVPCGHIAACRTCALRFEGESCPICKQLVCLVVKTYTA